MAADLMVVNKENEQLKGLLQEQESELRNIMVEYQRAQDQMGKMDDEIKGLHSDREVLKKQLAEGEKELKKSAEQLRIMAEKVFQLLNQLQKLDDWKKQAITKQKNSEHKIELLKVKAEALGENLRNTAKANKQLHASLKSANARMDKYKDLAMEHKAKFMSSEKIRTKLSSQVTGKDKQLHKLRGLHDSTLNKLRVEQHKNAAQLASIQKLQTTLMNHEMNRHQIDNRLKAVAADQRKLEADVEQRDNLIESYHAQDKHILKLKKLVESVNAEDLPPHMLSAMRELEEVTEKIKGDKVEVYGKNHDLMQRTEIKKFRNTSDAVSIVAKTTKRSEKKGGRTQSADNRRGRQPRGRGLSLASKRVKSSSRSAKRRSTSGSTRSTTVRVRTLFRSLQKEGNGKELKSMMKALQVDEATVVKWISDPKELVQGLRKVYRRVNSKEKRAKAMQEEFGGVNKKLEIVTSKNKTLLEKLNSTEESKTKTVMRFANVLAGISHMTARLVDREADIKARGGEEAVKAEQSKKDGEEDAAGAFLTQGEDEVGGRGDSSSTSIPPSVMAKDLPGIANLQLSENGIEDAEAVLIANALHDNQAVTEVTVRGNRIGDKGFVALGVSCLSNKSNVTYLDVQYNHITLKGIETFAIMLSEFADSSGHVLRSSFETEKGLLIPVIQVYIRGPRKLTVDLRFNKLKPELPEGSSQAAISKSEKEADAQLLKIVRILQRCGKHSKAHENMLIREAEYEQKRLTGTLPEEQRLVLHGGWTDSKPKKLISKNSRHKRGQSKRNSSSNHPLAMSVTVKKSSSKRAASTKGSTRGGYRSRRREMFIAI